VDHGVDHDLVRRRRFRSGDIIFHRDDPGSTLYLLESGQVKVYVPTEEGKDIILAMLTPGQFFGELSLLDHGPRTATVICESDCTLLLLSQRHFMAVLDDVPSMSHKLLASLAGRIRDLDRQYYG